MFPVACNTNIRYLLYWTVFGTHLLSSRSTRATLLPALSSSDVCRSKCYQLCTLRVQNVRYLLRVQICSVENNPVVWQFFDSLYNAFWQDGSTVQRSSSQPAGLLSPRLRYFVLTFRVTIPRPLPTYKAVRSSAHLMAFTGQSHSTVMGLVCYFKRLIPS